MISKTISLPKRATRIWMTLGCVAWVASSSMAQSPLEFRKHELESNLAALGADQGDRVVGGPADVIACEPQEVFLFSAGKKFSVHKSAEPSLFIHVRTADLDRDGDVDAVVADHANGRLLFLENPGTPQKTVGAWPRHIIDGKTRGAHAVALGDVDGDGWVDVVASGEVEADPPEKIFWFRNPLGGEAKGKPLRRLRSLTARSTSAGTPRSSKRDDWSKHVIGESGGLAHYPGVGDVNGDGRLDVVHAAKKGEWYRLYVAPKDPRSEWSMTSVGEKYIQATNIQIGDVDNDGDMDLLATQGHHYGISWFEAPGWKQHPIDQELNSPHTLAVADFDRDGKLDLAVCAYESKQLVWFRNTGSGRFQKQVISTNQAAYDLVARDMDGDGDLDLIVAGQNSKNVCWYEQVSPEVTPSVF